MMSMTMKKGYCMMAVALLMAACAEDNLQEVRPDGKVRVDVGCESQTEVQVGTRVADGYTTFGGADYDGVQLGVIAWQKNTQKYDQGFATYSYSNGAGTWTSNVYLAKQQYNVYGYMPHNGEANSIQPDLGSEANPSTFAMKWTGQPTFATKPVLASVGSAKSNGSSSSVADGSFEVNVDQVGQEEKINFRMNHLLAKLNLQFYLPQPYADKRKIKVTQVTLSGGQGVADRYDITCSYDANGALTTTYTPMQGASTSGNTYPYKDADGLLLTTDKQQFGTYYFVPDAVNRSSSNLMTLTVTYNVYDKNGTLTREHQTATNAKIALHKVNNVAQATQVAHEYTANVKVVPSYLYVLSDGDMQNPYIVLN